MVVVHCSDEDACEIKLRASGSLDLDFHHSFPPKLQQLKSTLEVSAEPDFRDQSSKSLRSTGTDHRSQPSIEYALSEEVTGFLCELGDPKDCRKLTLVRHGSKFHSSLDCYQVHNPFPVRTLTLILHQAKGLVCLELARIRLVGSSEEFADLARAIESLPFLQAFSMEQCRLNKSSAKQSALESVVKALASCTTICDVTLIADKPQSMGKLTTQTVGFLGRSPSLQILRLENLALGDPHITELSKALETNVMLQTLRLSCTVDDPGSHAIVQMLGSNSSIQAFDLFLEKIHNEDSTLRIAGALQSSESLKHYGLDFGSKNLSSRLLQVQNDVTETKELAKELEFSSTSLSNCPFIRMLNGAIDASLYFGRLVCAPTMVADQ